PARSRRCRRRSARGHRRRDARARARTRARRHERSLRRDEAPFGGFFPGDLSEGSTSRRRSQPPMTIAAPATHHEAPGSRGAVGVSSLPTGSLLAPSAGSFSGSGTGAASTYGPAGGPTSPF